MQTEQKQTDAPAESGGAQNTPTIPIVLVAMTEDQAHAIHAHFERCPACKAALVWIRTRGGL